MKIQYIGLLPLVFAFFAIHVWLWRDYRSVIQERGHFVFYRMDPVPMALALFLWISLIIGGVMWALTTP